MNTDIETARCGLVWPTAEDRDEFAKLYQCESGRRYLGGPRVGAAFDGIFARMLASRSPTSWTVRLKGDRSFIGWLALHPHHDGQDTEVSYQFLPEFWGRGLARETVGAVVDHARNTLALPRVVAEIQTANLRSRRLLESLGFEPLRTVRRFDEDQTIYGSPPAG